MRHLIRKTTNATADARIQNRQKYVRQDEQEKQNHERLFEQHTHGISQSGEIQLDLVDITPAPGFARFKGPHNWVVPIAVEVPGCVLSNRGVATAHMPAFQAQTQVNPALADFQALLATIGGARRDFADFPEMCTRCHIGPPFQWLAR